MVDRAMKVSDVNADWMGQLTSASGLVRQSYNLLDPETEWHIWILIAESVAKVNDAIRYLWLFSQSEKDTELAQNILDDMHHLLPKIRTIYDEREYLWFPQPEVISYAGSHALSWSGLALKAAELFECLARNTTLTESFHVIQDYDSDEVLQHLKIESRVVGQVMSAAKATNEQQSAGTWTGQPKIVSLIDEELIELKRLLEKPENKDAKLINVCREVEKTLGGSKAESIKRKWNRWKAENS